MKMCFALLANSLADEDALFNKVRYAQLVHIHGEPATWGGHKPPAAVSGVALSSRLIKLTFQCKNHEHVVQQVPPSMKIMALKLLCKRLFKLQSKNVILSHAPDADVLYELDDPMKTLGDYICGFVAVVVVR